MDQERDAATDRDHPVDFIAHHAHESTKPNGISSRDQLLIATVRFDSEGTQYRACVYYEATGDGAAGPWRPTHKEALRDARMIAGLYGGPVFWK
jgi:hypothetical protein